MDSAIYSYIGVIMVVAAILYYATRMDAGNRRQETQQLTEDEARDRVDKYLLKKWGKSINWENRLSYQHRTQPYDVHSRQYIGKGKYKEVNTIMTFYGVVAELHKDAGANVAERVRVIWDIDKDRCVLDEGIENDIAFRILKKNPCLDFEPLIHKGAYDNERVDSDKHTVNVYNKDSNRDFSNPSGDNS